MTLDECNNGIKVILGSYNVQVLELFVRCTYMLEPSHFIFTNCSGLVRRLISR